MKWREIADDYFTFTRKDRIGILILVLLVCFVFFAPKFFTSKPIQTPSSANDTAWIGAVKKLEISPEDTKNNSGDDDENIYAYQYDRSKKTHTNPTKGELFYFDPNTISEDDWKKLGLRDKTIHTIQNYLNKGGYFKKPEDLQKIYGLHPDEYQRLAPYIQIETKSKSSETSYQKEIQSPFSSIDINTADTTAFIVLPGIGSKLAARIVNFRDKLGGFYSTEQIRETYGLPDSTFQKIKPYLNLNSGVIKKININTATVNEFKAHPYIKYSIANLIVAYRNEHGPFSKVEDIKKIVVVTEELYNKINSYLTTQ